MEASARDSSVAKVQYRVMKEATQSHVNSDEYSYS